MSHCWCQPNQNHIFLRQWMTKHKCTLYHYVGPPGLPGSPGGGVSYTRWGKLTCPPGRQRAYDGAIVGSKYNEGGSSEFLCLHNQPDFLPTVPGSQGERSRMFGTELRNYVGHNENVPALSHLVNHEISCSVCYASSRSVMIIVPGRKTCPPSWTREYYEYMVADKYATHHRLRAPICLDFHAEAAYGS